MEKAHPPISRSASRAMGKFCRANKVKYVYSCGYTSTYRSALKNNIRAPNGILLHSPRDWMREFKGEHYLMESNRLYVCWLGEPIEAVTDALAYARTITRDKEFYIINCTKQEKRT